MAGDWIKMRTDLNTHPKVVRMASALKADTLRIVGGLHSAWCLFDVHSIDGVLEGYDSAALDSHIRFDGFSDAMKRVGWLDETSEGLVMPRFDAHNGQSAKRRAMDAERKREVRKTSASEADKKRTREEKRREESKPPQSPIGDCSPQGGDKKPAKGDKTFAKWIEDVKAAGQKPIPESDPIFEYAKQAGIPDDFLRIAWVEFKERYQHDSKRYKDWRQTFRNCVRASGYGLWRCEAGQYLLTSKGQQAMAALQHQDARKAA